MTPFLNFGQGAGFGFGLTAPMYPVPDEIYNQGNLDLNALVELSRRKRMMQEAAANVGGRRQELIEMGRMGPQPLANPYAAAGAVMARLPDYQAVEIAWDGYPTTVQEIPGIGHAIDHERGGRAVVGKYGTGTAAKRDDRNRKHSMIENMPAAEWFAKKAGEQGVSNRFATAVSTGVTDKQDPWGVKPRFTGKAVVADAMSKKK